MKGKAKIKKTWTPLLAVVLGFLIVYAVLFLAPVAWSLVSSVKSDYDFRHNMFGIPKEWSWDNYPHAFFGFFVEVREGTELSKVYMTEQFLNSFLYAGGCALAATYVPCHVGYLTAKYRYKFSKILTSVVIVCIALPIVGALPSEIQMARKLGLYDNIWGMWILKANFLSMYLLIFQGIFRGVAADFSEAAKMDGASALRIYLQIMLPLVSKTFLTVFLLNFITFWNDYQTPLVFMPNRPTVAYGLYEFNQRTDIEFSVVPLKIAGAVLVMLPVLVIFFAFQKKIMGNIVMGGLKG